MNYRFPRYAFEAICAQTALFSMSGPMISAEAPSSMRFIKVETSSQIWLYPTEDVLDRAEYIYARSKDLNKSSAGFGGRILEFHLSDTETVALQGPWKASASGLLAATGVDLTHTYLTQGIIALYRSHGRGGAPDLYVDVFHHDAEPVLGTFDRIEDLARNLSFHFRRDVVYASRSRGGGVSSTILYPKDSGK